MAASLRWQITVAVNAGRMSNDKHCNGLQLMCDKSACFAPVTCVTYCQSTADVT